MVIANTERVAKALDLLRDGLGPACEAPEPRRGDPRRCGQHPGCVECEAASSISSMTPVKRSFDAATTRPNLRSEGCMATARSGRSRSRTHWRQASAGTRSR